MEKEHSPLKYVFKNKYLLFSPFIPISVAFFYHFQLKSETNKL